MIESEPHLIFFENDPCMTERTKVSQRLQRVDALRNDLQALGTGVGDCPGNSGGCPGLRDAASGIASSFGDVRGASDASAT